MDVLASLGRMLGFSFTAGINLYATVAILGLATHFRWVDLPPQYGVFDQPWIIGGALVLYVIEFAADKIPWVDSIWDAVHTVIRPIGGAVVAVSALGNSAPATQAIAALLGGSIAMTTHLTKAGTRAVANTSPEPFSNWALSFAEDIVAVGLTWMAVRHPVLATGVAIVLLAIIVAAGSWILKALRRRFARRSA